MNKFWPWLHTCSNKNYTRENTCIFLQHLPNFFRCSVFVIGPWHFKLKPQNLWVKNFFSLISSDVWCHAHIYVSCYETLSHHKLLSRKIFILQKKYCASVWCTKLFQETLCTCTVYFLKHLEPLIFIHYKAYEMFQHYYGVARVCMIGYIMEVFWSLLGWVVFTWMWYCMHGRNSINNACMAYCMHWVQILLCFLVFRFVFNCLKKKQELNGVR